MSEKVLISSCLAGLKCRYNGKHCKREHFNQLDDALLVCPEQLGGLATPREPAEIQADGRVHTMRGDDVSTPYNQGAAKALTIALKNKVTKAYLKSKSPMCGAGKIYNGNFDGKLIAGDGVFTKLLRSNNIEVISVD